MTTNNKDRNSYRSIFKATALFGGVRVFQILISVIRSKVIALLIGPTGMGISVLLKSTTDTINHLTGLGLQTSAVRDVAKVYESENQSQINEIITVLRHLVWITGVLGAIVIFFASDLISNLAFGNCEYSSAFKILSVTMVLNQINVGQMALLQGTFHYKDIAFASLWGNLLSLVLTIPLYYFFKEAGIVPALVIASIIMLFFSWKYSHRIGVSKIKLSFHDFLYNSKGMITLGFVIALGGLIGNLSSYIMSIFLSNYGSVSIVGLYGAATTIANSYVFMVMSAMSSDYVPRIAALTGNPKGQIEAINKQLVLIMLILGPLVTAFIVYAKEVVYILYTSEFYDVVPMLQLFMIGMLFQAITWCISYAVVARGDSKIFLITEVYNFIISIALKIGGYLLFGLVGVGIGFIIDYILEGLLIIYVSKRKFNFIFNDEFIRICFLIVFLSALALITCMFISGYLKYILGSVLFIITCLFSLKELDIRIGMISKLKSKIL